MFMLFPGEWHTYRPDPATGWKEYWIGFEGPLAQEIAGKGFFAPEKAVFRPGLHEEIVNLYEEAVQVASGQASGFQQRLMGIVVHLMGMAVFFNRQQVFSQVSDLINRAKILISRECQTLRPEDIARKLNMGYSNFRKIFKEYTGFSPARYIQDVRFARIKESLTNSTLPVKQIAYENGFENYDYFFTAFRRITGMTPVAYRELTQGRKR
jgi:AraC-like DNA-binding protein